MAADAAIAAVAVAAVSAEEDVISVSYIKEVKKRQGLQKEAASKAKCAKSLAMTYKITPVRRARWTPCSSVGVRRWLPVLLPICPTQ